MSEWVEQCGWRLGCGMSVDGADLCRDCSMAEPLDVDEDRSAVIDSLPPASPSGSSANSLSPSDMTCVRWNDELRTIEIERPTKREGEQRDVLARRCEQCDDRGLEVAGENVNGDVDSNSVRRAELCSVLGQAVVSHCTARSMPPES